MTRANADHWRAAWMAAGLPLDVEEDHVAAPVLAAVERWRLADVELADARLGEGTLDGSVHPGIPIAGAVIVAVWFQLLGALEGLVASGYTAVAAAAAFFAWWIPRLVAHRRRLREAEAERHRAVAAVEASVRALFAAPFELPRGDALLVFNPPEGPSSPSR